MSNGTVLRRSSSGDGVRLLQRALAAAGFDPGGIDGVFGPRTERAVKAFQAMRGLAIDGVVGAATWGALRSRSLRPITVRQPQPFDIVDDPVGVCGIGTGFEATFHSRVRDAGGAVLAETFITAGTGTGGLGNFQVQLATGLPPTPQGTLEVFEFSAEDGSEINKVTVPVTFGRALIDPYAGFVQYIVAAGDTLSGVALQFYGDAALWPRIFEANLHQIADPDLIFPGQVLRIPQ